MDVILIQEHPGHLLQLLTRKLNNMIRKAVLLSCMLYFCSFALSINNNLRNTLASCNFYRAASVHYIFEASKYVASYVHSIRLLIKSDEIPLIQFGKNAVVTKLVQNRKRTVCLIVVTKKVCSLYYTLSKSNKST